MTEELPTLAERTSAAHKIAIEHKTDIVARYGGEHPMPFVTVAYRGRHQVAILFPANRDQMISAVRVAVVGLGADVVTACVDAYGVTGDVKDIETARINPDTGKRWAPGDMQRAFEAGRPWVHEDLHTYGLDRTEQQLVGVSTVYRVRHRQVRFEPERLFAEDEGTMTGLVPGALREALYGIDIEAAMSRLLDPALHFGLTSAQARAHIDVVVARQLAAMGIPMAYLAADAEAQEIFNSSLADVERNAAFGVPDLHVQPLPREG